MARAEKDVEIERLTKGFRESAATLLTEYRGLSVAQLKQLRTALSPNATYEVVKNTLTRRAAETAGFGEFVELLNGPSAITFVSGDTVAAAKGLNDFAKENTALVIKGGWMEGRMITPAEFKRLANLESREVLLAKLAGAMNASMAGAVSLFAAPLSQAARAFAALQATKEKE
jgi:large subunit ribosomal protein L10